MTNRKLFGLAVALCMICPAAFGQYGEYIYVTSATVSGPIIGGASPSATLTVHINDNNSSPGTNGIPIVVSSLVTVTCAGNTHLPYNTGCYAPPGATSIGIGLSYGAVSTITPITFVVAVEYDDAGQNVNAEVLPMATPVPSDTGCGGDSPNSVSPPCVAGRPINLASGNVFIQQTDIRQLPGLGNGLMLTRTWNSKWPSDEAGASVGMFGPNWRSTYEERIFVGSDGTIKLSGTDGSFKSFGYSNSTWVPVAPATFRANLSAGASNWTLTLADGEQRIFDNASGDLLAIIDRNGNTTTLTYDSLNRLVSVTDPSSRHLYFTYPDSSTRLVSAATTDVGHTVTYSYDTLERLIQVTETDNSKVSIEYDSNSFITAIKDSAGKILESHTYDSSGRGLSSSRANGVESLTVSYPPN